MEVLVAISIFGLMMTAVLAFYVEAIAVSAKREQQSERLRRFHIGLDKMEQLLREGRVISVTARTVTFLELVEPFERDGFPVFAPAPSQLASTEEGVVLLRDHQQIALLPTKKGENVKFRWLSEAPPDPPKGRVLNVYLEFRGEEEGRSDLFFHRTINPAVY